MATGGVNIPRLQTLNEQPAASVGRAQSPQVDVTQGMRQVGNAISELGGDVAQRLAKQEEMAIDNIATAKANQYENEYREALSGKNGARFAEGDPDKIYADFDSKMNARYQEILGETEGMNKRTRKAFEAKMNQRYSNLYDLRTTAWGNQYHNYVGKVRDGDVVLARQSAMDATSFMREGDTSTMSGFDAALDRIRSAYISYGEKTDGAEMIPGENGAPSRIRLSPQIDMALRKEVSETTTNAIENLIAANQVGLAKEMQARYGDNIDPVNKKKITESLRKADIVVQALAAVTKGEAKNFEQQMVELNKIKDPEVKQKALELLDSRTRYIENLNKRQSDSTYDRLANMVNSRMNSDNPYLDRLSLEEDPMFKREIRFVTDSKQREALYQMVEAPKESNQEKKDAFLTALANGELNGMSVAKLNEMKEGLNKEDRTIFDAEWRKWNTEGDAEERSRARFVQNGIRQALERAQIIKKNPRTGQYSRRDLKTLNDAQTRVLVEFDKFPKGTPVGQLTEWVNNYAAELAIQKSKENTGWFGSFFGGSIPEPRPLESIRQGPGRPRKQEGPSAPSVPSNPAQEGSGGAFSKMTPQERLQRINEFKQANGGRTPKDSKELADFISQGK